MSKKRNVHERKSTAEEKQEKVTEREQEKKDKNQKTAKKNAENMKRNRKRKGRVKWDREKMGQHDKEMKINCMRKIKETSKTRKGKETRGFYKNKAKAVKFISFKRK